MTVDHSAGYDRIGALYRVLANRWPSGIDDLTRDRMAAQLADLESEVAAALALFLQGDGALTHQVLAHYDPQVGIPLAAAFGAAGEALLAVIGEGDQGVMPSPYGRAGGGRGPLAVRALQARSAEFRAAHELLVARHADVNPGN